MRAKVMRVSAELWQELLQLPKTTKITAVEIDRDAFRHPTQDLLLRLEDPSWPEVEPN